MSVVGGSHLKRPWDDKENHNLNSQRPRLSASVADESATRSPRAASPIAPQLSPISTTIEPALHLPHLSPPSSRGEPRQYTGFPSLYPPRTQGSAKRIRLYYDDMDPTISASLHRDPNSEDTHAGGRIDDRDRQVRYYPTASKAGHDSSEDVVCRNCSDTEELVHKIVAGLLGLQTDIREAAALPRRPEGVNEATQEGILQFDLRSSLVWACGSIEMSAYLLREGALTRPAFGLPPIDPPTSERVSAPGSLSRHILDLYEKDRTEDYNRPYNSTLHSIHPSRQPDYASPSSIVSDHMRKGPAPDQTLTQALHSPPHSVSGSTYGSGQSPSQMQASHRMLPSPTSMHYQPSAPGVPTTFSPSNNQSVHNDHLQDLQHQISTKTLALQTLQREHDQLLAAFSRSQIRCATLDKKSQVSDHEINSVTEEKIRLQTLVETLENQVEELIQTKDEVQKQTTANSTQWQRIMAMSSQLQARGAEETLRHKSDRESWERDRDGLQRRISALESEKLTMADPVHSYEQTSRVSSGDILASTSLESLRAEIVRLRSKCAEMEVALQELRRVTEQMDQVISEFSSIRERITTQIRHGLPGEHQGGTSLRDTLPSKSTD